FRFKGIDLQTTNVVQVINTVNGAGTLRNPMPVGPPGSISINPGAGILPLGRATFPLNVRLHSNVDGAARETVRLELPNGWSSEPASAPIAFTQMGQDQAVTFTVHPGAVAEKPYQITAAVDYEGKSYREGYGTTGYTGLRPYFLYKPST